MPGFVKSPEDEKKWSASKDAAGTDTSTGKPKYALANYIFHNHGGPTGEPDADDTKRAARRQALKQGVKK